MKKKIKEREKGEAQTMPKCSCLPGGVCPLCYWHPKRFVRDKRDEGIKNPLVTD